MMGHDARRTGRVDVVPADLARRGQVKWMYDLDDSHPSYPNEVDAVHGGVAIGPDGKLFLGTVSGRFVCLDRQGRRVWSYPPGNQPAACAPGEGVYGTPALGVASPLPRDGMGDWIPLENYNAYFTTDDGRLWCFHHNGALRWVVTNGAGRDPTISRNGRILVGAARSGVGYLDAYNESGVLAWTLPLPGSTGVYAGPAICLDGTIYVADGQARLHAVLDRGTNGELKWQSPYLLPQGRHAVLAPPVVGDDGTIYVATFGSFSEPSGVAAVTDLGTTAANKWTRRMNGRWYVGDASGPSGLEPVSMIEGGLFLDWREGGSQVWFGTFQGMLFGHPSRFIRLREMQEGDDFWGEAWVVTSDEIDANVDAVGVCARYVEQGQTKQAIVIAYEEPIIYSFKTESWWLNPDPWWRMDRPAFPDMLESPKLALDSDGTVYIGTSDPRYVSGRLIAVWGP